VLYQMKQKILCFGDDFIIRDHASNEAYYVDGKVLSIRDSLSFQDMNEHELATIRQRLLAIGKTYDIEYQGKTTTVHKHLFTPFTCKFDVDLAGHNDLEAKGNLLDMEYEFMTANHGVIATVSRRWFTIADSYGIEIAAGWDPVWILASAVVIDLCCHEDRAGH